MVGSYRETPGYEPLRRNDPPGIGQAITTPTPASRQFDRTLTDAGQPPLERPTLGTPSSSAQPSTKVTTPPSGPRSSYHAPSIESFPARERDLYNERKSHDRDFYNERRSMDSKNPLLNKNRSSAATSSRPATALTRQLSEDMADEAADREQPGSYFEGAAIPQPGQFMANRGRPMSFYDMKEQQREKSRQQQQQPPRPAPQLHRQSWRSGDMPYNYADMIGDNRYSYAPPRMGSNTPQRGFRGGSASGEPEQPMPVRLPWTMWMNSSAKNLFVAAVGEWVGTTMFLFFAFAGTQVANAKSDTPAESTTTNATTGFDPVVMLYISTAFGFSLMVNVWVFFRISGGLFNPAVTLALWVTGAVSAARGICLFFAQIVGSITASALVLAIFPTPLNVRTTLSAGTSLAQGVWIEAFMTAELVFTILMLAKEKHRATFIAPVGIGLALFVAELVGVYYTGGSLNPARSLGPCVVSGKWDAEHWIYWVGPGIGCAFALAFYKFIKMLEYEMANPGQDGDDANDPTKNPNHAVREKQREVTARVLASLGIDANSQQQQQQQADAMAAEEGSYYGGGRNSVMGDSDSGHQQRVYPGGGGGMHALSTVASMSDVNSPTKAYAPQPRSSFQVD
ncbi:Uu.00g072510.m01.CDS01 [Anthostomella pinea]|uniref:Uu.00g072510.m01.CDS01 n=1 Tax=Anthostomella pinea TaxID=933095 RepID=A0AAI8VV49_9PEZI|nr:Uu.00g072510.m01.CDS01 [Anthostomella pinea]